MEKISMEKIAAAFGIITFPKAEYNSLTNRLAQGKPIMTTRVSLEKDKYKVGKVYRSDLGVKLKVVSVKSYNSINEHPYLGELTSTQKNAISKYGPYDFIVLRKVSEAMNKDAMEKIALPKWKSIYGELSQFAKNKLLMSGIHNPEKEMFGIQKGTRQLVKSQGGIIDRSKTGHKIIHEIMTRGKQMGDSSEEIDALKNIVSLKHDRGRGFMTIPMVKGVPNVTDSKSIVGQGSYKRHLSPEPAEFLKKQNRLSGDDLFQFVHDAMKKGTKSERNYLDALANRHEADELRYFNKNTKLGKHTKMTEKGEWPRTSILGHHISPNVLHQESTHIALAPPNVGNVLLTMRGSPDYGDEGVWLKKHGLEYGKSTRFNKKLAKKLDDDLIRTSIEYEARSKRLAEYKARSAKWEAEDAIDQANYDAKLKNTNDFNDRRKVMDEYYESKRQKRMDRYK